MRMNMKLFQLSLENIYNRSVKGFVTILFSCIPFLLFSQTPEVIIRSGNESDVEYIEFDPGARNFLTVDVNKKVQIWDTYTGINYSAYQNDNLLGATFNRKGELIVLTGEFDYEQNAVEISVINESVRKVENLYEFDSLYPEEARFAREGRFIYLSFRARYRTPDGGTATPLIWQNYLIDRESNESLLFSEDVNGIHISRDDEALVLRVGYEIQVYKLSAMEFQHSFSCTEYDSGPLFDEISPDGRYFLSRFADSVRIWDVRTGDKVRSFQCALMEGPVTFTRNSDVISFADPGFPSEGSTLKFADITSGEILAAYDSDKINAMNVSADGRYLVAAGSGNSISLWNPGDGSLIRNLQAENELITDIQFLHDNLSFVTTGTILHSSVRPGYLKKWNLPTGRLEEAFQAHEVAISTVAVSRVDERIVYGGNMYPRAKIYDFDTKKTGRLKTENVDGFQYLDISADGRLLASLDGKGEWVNSVTVWDLDTKRKVGGPFELSDFFSENKQYMDLSEDGNTLAVRTQDSIINLIDPLTGTIRKSYNSNPFSWFAFSPGNQLFAYTASDKELVICEMPSGDRVKTIPLFADNSDFMHYSIFEFSKDGKLMAFKSTDNEFLEIYSTETFQLLSRIPESAASLWSFDNQSKKIAIGSRQDDRIRIYDIQTNSYLSSFEAIRSGYFAFTPDDRFLLTYGDKSYFTLWDHAKGEKVVDIYSFYPDQFITITPDHYYSISRNSGSYVAFLVNDKLFPFEQFDLIYNRPDIVAQRLNYADRALIETYHSAYKKRLGKMGFNEEMIRSDFHLPQIAILSAGEIPMRTTSNTIKFEIKAFDLNYKLERINLWVNDVPYYGMKGMSLHGQNTSEIKEWMEVELSAGRNKIQVSGHNENGAESLKETLYVNCDKPGAGARVFFIGIGVSGYRDETYNLTYAAKDIRDLSGIISKHYDRVIVDTLLDESVTRENVLNLKDKLMMSNVDDIVIIALSGHGLLSKDLDFYYATHDIDFSVPELSGINYDDIESLLDGIPARKKILMMDACHTGEIDKEEFHHVVVSENGTISKVDGTPSQKGTGLFSSPSETRLKNSFQMMQELFSNLSRGSGTMVISAAAGNSYALESEIWKNGVFTYSVINGLNNMKADSDRDGEITVSELKDYVILSVQELTNGRQKPTVRQENIENDFRIW
jgi:WD40 repeat protein